MLGKVEWSIVFSGVEERVVMGAWEVEGCWGIGYWGMWPC